MCLLKENILNNILLYNAPELFKKYGIDIYFTSRLGGYSLGNYSSLNLAFHVGDNIESVNKNRNKLKKLLNIEEQIKNLKQIHSEKIIFLNKISNKIPRADALVTNLENTPIMVMGADCNLIIIVDIIKKVVAAVHAGWEGTKKKILQKTIIFFKKNFNSKKLFFYFGPSIRKCCYEVSRDRLDLFINEFGNDNFYYLNNEKIFLDLIELNKKQIIDEKIPESRIFDSGICTFCDERFYSYRRDKITGRQGAIAIIRK